MTTLERMVEAVRKMPVAILVFRRRAHLSIEQTARRAGVAPKDWRRYESGAVLPEGEELHALAKAVNTDLETLARYAFTLILAEELAGFSHEIPDGNNLAPRLRHLARSHDSLARHIAFVIDLALGRLAYEKSLKRLEQPDEAGRNES